MEQFVGHATYAWALLVETRSFVGKGPSMKTLLAVAAIVTGIALAPAAASAGERLGDAAMGAASGALVAGPVGLVAGGIIGYTAGPGISHGMGLHHHRYRGQRNRYSERRRIERD
jgi:hypothetical protein